MTAQLTKQDLLDIEHANRLVRQRQIEPAAEIAQALYQKAPESEDVAALLAEINIALGNAQVGIGVFSQLVGADPENAYLLGRLGYAFLKAGDQDRAQHYLEQSVVRKPALLDNQMFLAALYQEKQRWEQAAPIYLKYAEKYGSAEILHHAANGFMDAENFQQAEKFYRSALRIDGRQWKSWAGLAQALFQRVIREPGARPQMLEEIKRICQKTEPHVDQNTGLLQILFTKANVLNHEGKVEEARNILNNVLAIDPEHKEARNNLALLELSSRNFSTGWPLYRDRATFASANLGYQSLINAGVLKPQWQGQPLAGKTLLVISEQGIGDQILHSQHLLTLQRAGASIILTCNTKLTTVFARSFPEITVLPDTEQVPKDLVEGVDYYVSIVDIGAITGFNLTEYRAPEQYIKPDPALVDSMRQRLNALSDKPKIGVAWQSFAPTGGQKTIPLTLWKHILKNPDYQFISLQYQADLKEIEKFNKKNGTQLWADPTFDPFFDVEQAAAQIAALDLVISISNASVHLAASMGIPVWLLVTTRPIWHWFKEGDRSPWYPSLHIFRQSAPLNWNPVMKQVDERLKQPGEFHQKARHPFHPTCSGE